MKRHDIRLRKQEFSTSRIKQYKDYQLLMRKHQRVMRMRTMIQSSVAVVLLIFVTSILYFGKSSMLNNAIFPENQQFTVESPKATIYEFEELVIHTVGGKASPEGGLKAYGDYLQQSLDYPKEAIEHNIQGFVNVQFLVNKDGSLSDFRIINGLGYGCDEEAIRLIKEGPEWQPEVVDGKILAGGMIVPVIFIRNN